MVKAKQGSSLADSCGAVLSIYSRRCEVWRQEPKRILHGRRKGRARTLLPTGKTTVGRICVSLFSLLGKKAQPRLDLLFQAPSPLHPSCPTTSNIQSDKGMK